MSEVALACIYALAVWWASTGAILVLAGLPRAWHRRMVAASAPFGLLGGGMMVAAATDPGIVAAYLGFTGAIMLWGWHELAFLTGIVTGPSKQPCPVDAGFWRRFGAAVMVLAWHELALLGTALVLLALTWADPHPFGVWAFLVLFVARISAKLNVFLGVPNLAAHFVPDQLAHLKSYFRIRAMNLLFPFSVTLGMAVVFGFGLEAWEEGETMVGFSLLAGLTGLAVLEHWLLVLPVRDSALWAWLLPRSDARRAPVLVAANSPRRPAFARGGLPRTTLTPTAPVRMD